MTKTRNILIVTLSVIAIFLIVFFISEKQTYAKPLSAFNTDGTPSTIIINNMNASHQKVILKTSPFGYIEIRGWDSQGLIKKVVATVEWKTYEDMGAGNIYIGYSFGGNYTEIGPFRESENFTTNEIEIPLISSNEISKLKVRFRGEDLDFGPDAIADVSIKLKVIYYGF
jgi:hypothetical protein